MYAPNPIGLCLLFWLLCWLGTGTDEKNVKSYRSYPDAVQKKIRENPRLAPLVREASPGAVFLSNVLLFSVILLVLGLPIRQQGFFRTFLNILIMGQVLNAFDYFIMDRLWFRNTRRTRFSGTEDQKELYRDDSNHRAAFLRGIPAFLTVAVVDGLILMLFK